MRSFPRLWLFIAASFAIVTFSLGWAGWRGYGASHLLQPQKWSFHTPPPTAQETLFEQVFSAEHPNPYDYSTLTAVCRNAPATPDAPYLNCSGIALGLTTIMSMMKVCLKMTVDSGSNLLLPKIPLRDSQELHEFNLKNQDAFLPYDQWWDVDHLTEQMAKACPNTHIVHPDDLNEKVTVKNTLEVSLTDDYFYSILQPYFWAGRPFRPWFDEHYASSRREIDNRATDSTAEGGITIVNIDSEFMAFNILNDPTGYDLKLWNDLARILRFRYEPRQIVDRLIKKINQPYYAVHFRTEGDSVWSSLEDQLQRNFKGLDDAWEKHGKLDETKPLIYVACGDEKQADRFVRAAKEHGWEATHKYSLMKDDQETEGMINDLPFDFQGAVDLGIMVRSGFFFGLGGSAMSFTVANYRDPTGHYRGSSFLLEDDDGARNHLFYDFDNPGYPCCL